MNMFIGELCCIFGYFYVYRKQKKEHGNELTDEEKDAVSKGLSLTFNPLWFAIPAVFDIITSTLMYYGLVTVDASVMQIINCTILIWIAIFSIIYLKRKYTLQQYLGLGILVGGVTIVAVGAILTSNEGSSKGSHKNNILGVIALVVSVMFGGMLMVAEEKLLSKFYVHPLQAVGIEGASGLTIYIILLVVFYFIPCVPTPGFCPYKRLEDAPRAIMEIGTNLKLFFLVIATVTSLGFFNYFGISLTKVASATHRGAVNAIRPFTVWIYCLIAGWEKFSWIQLLGYFIAVYGMLLYYGIIGLIPWRCEKKNDGEMLETKEEED